MKGIIVQTKKEVIASGRDAVELSDDLSEMVANGAVVLPSTVELIGIEMDDDYMQWKEKENDTDNAHTSTAASDMDCGSQRPDDDTSEKLAQGILSDEEEISNERGRLAAFLRYMADEIAPEKE